MTHFKRLVVLIALAYLFTSVQPAAAHGYIVRAIPQDRAVLERAPTRVQYWFSEELEPDFSVLNVRDQHGSIIATGSVDTADQTLMMVKLPPGLPEGAYVVELRPAFASDGHVAAESRVFFVGTQVGEVAMAAANNQAAPLEVIWRTLVLSATMLLFGTFTLYALILVPAWGSQEYSAGFLPPRVLGRLNAVVISALALAFAGNVLALIQQTMVFFNVDAATAISGNLWSVVRIGSRFGDLWTARMACLVITAILHGAGLYLRRDYPETVAAFWTANAWLMALVIGTLSFGSHAAGSLLWPWVAITMDWLHALGVAFWAGGVAALVLVLPTALAPYEGEARRLALLAVMRRFSRLAAACVAIVITTGIYSALNWLNTPADLTQTRYGSALLLKGLLVGLLLLVAALHHLALHPALAVRLERLTVFTGVLQRIGVDVFYKLMARAGAFAATLGLEVVLVVIVLASVGLLSATPVPEPEFLKRQVETPQQAQTVDDLTITQTIAPGGPGINTLDTLVTRNDQPVDGLTVAVQTVNPARDWRGAWQAAEPVDTGLYVTAGDEIDRVGQWWTIVDLTESTGTTRAAFDWTISADAAIITTRPPTMVNLLALAGVLVALGWVAYPAANRYYQRLDLSPAAVTIALGSIALTIVAVLVGFIGVQDAQRRSEEALFPPPSVVNSVLPDAASLQRGHDLFVAHCAVWPPDSPDFTALVNKLVTMRDNELYQAILNGWRTLPPCTRDLNAQERWDMVNYLRGQEVTSSK
jgi:copper transport protein